MKSSDKDSLTLKTMDKKHFQVPTKFMELCGGLNKRRPIVTRAPEG